MYEYDLRDPATFKVYPAPSVDLEGVVKREDPYGNTVYELEFAGKDLADNARLRLIWGATHREPKNGRLELKYHHLTGFARWPTGRMFTASGLEIVLADDLAPPRWIVEELVSDKKHEGREGGVLYDYYWMCATAPRPGFPDGCFRHFDGEVLSVVREMFWLEMNRDDRDVEMMRRESIERAKQGDPDAPWIPEEILTLQ